MNNEQAIEVLKDLPPLKFSQRLAVSKAIAALSAKPEPTVSAFATPVPSTYGPDGIVGDSSGDVAGPDGWVPHKKSEPAKLPEVDALVSQFLVSKKEQVTERDKYGESCYAIKYYDADDVADFIPELIAKLTAAHAAALVEAEANGRREALQAIRPTRWNQVMNDAWNLAIPDTHKAFDALIDAMKQQTEETK